MKYPKTLALVWQGYSSPWALWAAVALLGTGGWLTRKSKLNTGMWLSENFGGQTVKYRKNSTNPTRY